MPQQANAENRQARAEEYHSKWGGILVEQADGDWLVVESVTGVGNAQSLCFHEKGIRRIDVPLGPQSNPIAANDNRQQQWPGIVSSGDLVRGFVPPDYHYDGIAQSGFLYGTTAMTGTGKTAFLLLVAAHTALGEPLAGRDMRKGRVIYFAGENPDDVTMRWIAMAHHLDFDVEAMDVHFIKGTFSIPQMFARIEADVRRLGGAELIVVDTSAAYFQGAEENSNTELGRHARDLRTLTTLPGTPCVMVACHPVKNADSSNLLPRGGGAFLNELDGNLVLIKGEDGTIRLHWHGKHRGADFEPVYFELKTVTAPLLKDSKDRDVPTVMASALTSGEQRKRRETACRDEDDVVLQIERDGGQSLTDMADVLGWKKDDGAPDKRRAASATEKLKRDKLAEYHRSRWRLTKAGETAATEIRNERHRIHAASRMASKMLGREGAD
jgi:hypothetical protein